MFICLHYCLKIHAQPNDEAEVVRLGLNVVQARPRIGNAIPDKGDIQIETLGQFKRQGADAVVRGFADFAAGVLAAIFQGQLGAMGNVPLKTAAERERGGAFLGRFTRLAVFKPGILVGRAGGNVPLQRRAINRLYGL